MNGAHDFVKNHQLFSNVVMYEIEVERQSTG